MTKRKTTTKAKARLLTRHETRRLDDRHAYTDDEHAAARQSPGRGGNKSNADQRLISPMDRAIGTASKNFPRYWGVTEDGCIQSSHVPLAADMRMAVTFGENAPPVVSELLLRLLENVRATHARSKSFAYDPEDEVPF